MEEIFGKINRATSFIMAPVLYVRILYIRILHRIMFLTAHLQNTEKKKTY